MSVLTEYKYTQILEKKILCSGFKQKYQYHRKDKITSL